MVYNAGLLLMTTQQRNRSCSEAGVAQLVERNLAKVEVESSRLFSRSSRKTGSVVKVVNESSNAGVAQLVERNLAKVEVESSRLFSRSRIQGRQRLTALASGSNSFLWRGSKAVMQRPAKPSRSVRLRSSPPSFWRMQYVLHAGVAQLVERNLAKVEVESSRLFSRSNIKKGSRCGCPFCIPPHLPRMLA